MSRDNKKPTDGFKKRVAFDDMALENAKNTLSFNSVNTVDDTAVNETPNRVNEARSTMVDLTDAFSTETQYPMTSGRDESDATAGHTPGSNAASMKSANTDAFFAALKNAMVFEHQTSESVAVPPSGNESPYIFTTLADGTKVRKNYKYATPTDEEAETTRRNDEQLMARRHSTVKNGRASTSTRKDLAPNFSEDHDLVSDYPATNAVLAAGNQAMSLETTRHHGSVENLGLDRGATSTIQKLMDLRSSVDSMIETSKASQGGHVPNFSAFSNTGNSDIAAMSTAGYEETGRLPAYPASLQSLPSPRKSKNIGLGAKNPAASNRVIAPKPIVDSSNLASRLVEHCVPTGPTEYTAFPPVPKKRVLRSQNDKPARPTKKRAAFFGDVSTPAPDHRLPMAGNNASAAQFHQGSAVYVEGSSAAQSHQGQASHGEEALASQSDLGRAVYGDKFSPFSGPFIPSHLVALVEDRIFSPQAHLRPAITLTDIIAAQPPSRPAILIGDDLRLVQSLTRPVVHDYQEEAPLPPSIIPEHPLFPGSEDSPVPQTWQEASDPDRMLYHLSEMGRGWPEIRTEWNRMTGQWHPEHVLANRLARFQDNLRALKEGDVQRLLTAVRDVESDYRLTKWARIAARIVQNGGDDYPLAFLQRKHKELEFHSVLAKGDELTRQLWGASGSGEAGAGAGPVVDMGGYGN
ncbi:hypothetical protein LPUS_10309 [Lasallia pustulata]|uniref:Uncharacterized protein n=1 Tax=Lasallia pustulata TaxID=136370 RepID=A0A1W5D971_9LECA|nr:hypothetical protein LPUS_10309 [Lasallia pustulata]